MEVVNERCCGLDIHKQTVVACVIVPGSGRQPHKEIRTFGTMTADLLELADWLAECQVTHVAMESTGVYWKPIWNLLEDQVELLLVNAHHVKQVPGRKTDVKDCEWLADLLRHGLLRASFVPDRPQRELRELTRYRTSLIRERSAEINRVQKTLEGANIKLGDVASNVLGVSGRQILTALVSGTATRPCWPTWLEASYGPNCPSCSARSSVSSDHTSASCLPNNWRIWTPWMSSSNNSTLKWSNGYALLRTPSTAWTPSQASVDAPPRPSSPRSAST